MVIYMVKNIYSTTGEIKNGNHNGLKNKALMVMLFMTLVLVHTTPVFADTFTWSATTNDAPWNAAASWTKDGTDADGIPDSNDVIVFDGTSTVTSVIDTDFAISRIQVGAAYTGQISLGTNTLSLVSEFTVANAGSFDAGTGRVRFKGTLTANSTASVYDLEIDNNGNTVTLSQDLVVNNDLTLTDLNSLAFPPYILKSTSTVSLNKPLNPIISKVLVDIPVKFRCKFFT
jgi:hypothetical protein